MPDRTFSYVNDSLGITCLIREVTMDGCTRFLHYPPPMPGTSEEALARLAIKDFLERSGAGGT